MTKQITRLLAVLLTLLAGGVGAYWILLRGTQISHTAGAGPVKQCAFIGSLAESSGNPELLTSTDCGTIDARGTLQVEKTLLKKLFFKESEPACMLLQDRAFYIDKSGRTVETYLFDAGCDYFNEGLARAPTDNGMRFIDSNLNVVITTPYQFAAPFQDGIAVVCEELRLRPALRGEHEKFVGGQCGYIDKHGEVVVPLRYPMEEIYLHRPARGLNG